jgi:hypothetical protein
MSPAGSAGVGQEGWVRSSAWIYDFSSTPQHDRMRRRLQAQPDHVADSGLQLQVAGEPEGLGRPGFDVVLGPHPPDRAVGWFPAGRPAADLTSGSPQAPRSDPEDPDALRVDLRPREGWGRACVKWFLTLL